MIKHLIAILIMLAFCSEASAQSHYQVHAGTAFPVGDFYLDNYEDVAVGVAAGAQYLYSIQQTGISLLVSADFFYNTLKKEYREEITRVVDFSNPENVNIKFYKYYNIPVLAGINYTLNASKPFAFMAEAGFGIDFLEMNDMTVETDQMSSKYELITFTAPCFKVGIGLILHQKYSLACDFHALGKHKIKGSTVIDGQIAVFEETGFVGRILSLTLGYKF
jgi:hypothetical protein